MIKKGLVINIISNLFIVEINNETYECASRGKFKKEEILPVVGDIVDVEILDKSKGVINKVYKRTSYIKRPKIANISQMLLVISSKNPKPDLLMLDKQLCFAQYVNIKPIIVINKIDLDNKTAQTIENVYKNIGYKVIKTNAKTGEGILELKEILNKNISAFSGNSGVGKSSIINKIFENNVTEEGEVSFKNKKGKNTTTHTKLYKIDKETYIADTPGFGVFDIYEIESNNLDEFFLEFSKYINSCEYQDCNHIKEENCKIKEKVLEGEIDSGRYNRFCKIYEELKDREEHKW